MIVENMTFGHLELTDCLELSAKLGANRQRGTSLKILGPAVAEKYGLTYDTTNDVKKLVEHLQRGGMAIANSGGDREGYVGLFTHGGHYITILSTDGKDACILDPLIKKESTRKKDGRERRRFTSPLCTAPWTYCWRTAPTAIRPSTCLQESADLPELISGRPVVYKNTRKVS